VDSASSSGDHLTKSSSRSEGRERAVAVVVLAAGESKRFKSRTPKVLHDLCGLPIIAHVLRRLAPLGASRTVLVVGREAGAVKEAVKRVASKIRFAEQVSRLGTADAARIGDEALGAFKGDVLITPGDTPLLDPATMRDLLDRHRATGAAATVLSARFDDPGGYGRIVRDPDGGVARIVEHADATEAERAIGECNAGVYVFDRAALRSALTKVEAANRQGELYLTDVIEILKDKGERIEAYVAPDATQVFGINDRAHLAEAAAIVRAAIAADMMRAGVTIEDPATTYIDATVTAGPDTIIRPMTFLRGATTIGRGCVIGPEAELIDCTLGDAVTISRAVAREVSLEKGATVGPYASLRPGTVLKAGAKAGTFVEMKQTTVGRGSKVPHLSYMGDATIGSGSNIGAGTITCNYDGETKRKSKTLIGDGVLVGSDTMLVAPVTLAKWAVTGAGSVVTQDVAANTVVAGVPATPRRKRRPAPKAKASNTSAKKKGKQK